VSAPAIPHRTRLTGNSAPKTPACWCHSSWGCGPSHIHLTRITGGSGRGAGHPPKVSRAGPALGAGGGRVRFGPPRSGRRSGRY